jgi:hypothetical protein
MTKVQGTVFNFTITGVTPLILHADSVEWADQMEAWKNDPNNKKDSRAGDDRTPAFRWLGCVACDEKAWVLPTENLAACLMKAAARVPMPGGRGSKTFKEESMSGMSIDGVGLPLKVNGKVLPKTLLTSLEKEKDFSKHQAACQAAGVELFVKRASVNNTKHIRVRPRLVGWSCGGELVVWDERLEKSLPQIFDIAGKQIGLGDWRPSSPRKPGPYGRFEVELVKA